MKVGRFVTVGSKLKSGKGERMPKLIFGQGRNIEINFIECQQRGDK